MDGRTGKERTWIDRHAGRQEVDQKKKRGDRDRERER